MFFNCYEFDCDLSKWDMSHVKNMYSMFYGCIALGKTPSWFYRK